MVKTTVKRYATSKVNIRTAPNTNDPGYLPWCNDLFDARYQLHLICEDSTVQSGINWTDGAEGNSFAPKTFCELDLTPI